MKKINNYVESVYAQVDGNNKEIAELKEEMKNHLLESVQELVAEGKTEEEAVNIAISRFGEHNELQEALAQVFQKQKNFAKWLLYIGIVFLVTGFIGFGVIRTYSEKASNEASHLVTEILQQLNKNQDFTPETKEEINTLIHSKKYISTVDIYQYHSETLPENIFIIDHLDKLDSIYSYDHPKTKAIQPIIDEFTLTTADGTWLVACHFLNFGNLELICALIGMAIYMVLFTIWATIKSYHEKRVNGGWILMFAIFNIFGYIAYLVYRKVSNK